MNPVQFVQLADDHTRTELASAAVGDVANLILHAVNSLPTESQVRFLELMNSGARLDVIFTLQHGAASIAATLESVPFFNVSLGSGEQEATRH